jgi:hypothetical protein
MKIYEELSMKKDYIITNEELTNEYGLNLNDYAISGTMVNAIIKIAFNLGITRILFLNDNFLSAKDIESAIDLDSELVEPFKKLQHRIIYNLIFVGDKDPIDKSVDDIIGADLHWGKVNTFQKYVR